MGKPNHPIAILYSLQNFFLFPVFPSSPVAGSLLKTDNVYSISPDLTLNWSKRNAT